MTFIGPEDHELAACFHTEPPFAFVHRREMTGALQSQRNPLVLG